MPWHDSMMHDSAQHKIDLGDTVGTNPVYHATFLPLKSWLIEGLRAGFFLSPRTAARSPKPLQVVLIFTAAIGLELALSRLNVVGPANFNAQAWLSGWWSSLVFLAACWWALTTVATVTASTQATQAIQATQAGHGGSRLAACFALSAVAAIPALLVYELVMAVLTHKLIKPSGRLTAWIYWLNIGVFLLWFLSAQIVLVRRFIGWTGRTAFVALSMIASIGISTSQFDQRTWQEDYSAQSKADADKPRLQLSQQAFEVQQELWANKVNALALQRDGVADVYGLVFAPYASEDVFKRESTLVADILSQRFDAQSRVLHLLNHASTAQTHLWATLQNAERAIQALAERMDKDNDVLVVYLTSHGGSDFKLAASHWPLEVEPLTPQLLRAALDKAGIRNRVIAVSACYSGGWVAPLASDNTLVMTAADATHTSYGCGRLSELTYFGRAMFDEQLRKTRSFESAFAKAVPLIKQREIDAGKDDGFSNPQISVGSGIQTVLKSLEARLEALPSTPPALSESPAAK